MTLRDFAQPDKPSGCGVFLKLLDCFGSGGGGFVGRVGEQDTLLTPAIFIFSLLAQPSNLGILLAINTALRESQL